MDAQSAADNLQLIRTLMERATLYRRALAPIMLLSGSLGLAGAALALVLRIESMHGFCLFWLGVAAIGLLAAYGVARRQALRDREAFWSPPARRVSAALTPPLLIGGFLGLGMLQLSDGAARDYVVVPTLWIALYGCALHGAGHFTTRGLRVFGGSFLFPASLAIPFVISPPGDWPWPLPHVVMGTWFGLFHLVYGLYLRTTEKRAATT
jgi:hypothetical protein